MLTLVITPCQYDDLIMLILFQAQLPALPQTCFSQKILSLLSE